MQSSIYLFGAVCCPKFVAVTFPEFVEGYCPGLDWLLLTGMLPLVADEALAGCPLK